MFEHLKRNIYQSIVIHWIFYYGKNTRDFTMNVYIEKLNMATYRFLNYV